MFVVSFSQMKKDPSSDPATMYCPLLEKNMPYRYDFEKQVQTIIQYFLKIISPYIKPKQAGNIMPPKPRIDFEI